MPQTGKSPIKDSVEDVVDENVLDDEQAGIVLPPPQYLPQRWPTQERNRDVFHWVDDAIRNDAVARIRHDLDVIVQSAEDAVNVLESIEDSAEVPAPRHAHAEAAARPQIERDNSIKGSAACMKAGPADWAREVTDFRIVTRKPMQSRYPSGPSCSFVAQGSKDTSVSADNSSEELNYADLAAQALSLPIPPRFSSVSDLNRKSSAPKKYESSLSFNTEHSYARQGDQKQSNSRTCDSESQVSIFSDLIAHVLNISDTSANTRDSATDVMAEQLGEATSSSNVAHETARRHTTDESAPRLHNPSQATSREIGVQCQLDLLQPINSACAEAPNMASCMEEIRAFSTPVSEKSSGKCILKPKSKLPNKGPLENNTDKSSSSGDDTDDTLTPEDRADEKADN